MADLKKFVKDAGYVTVGLGVIGFQRAQVRRQELQKQFESQREELRKQFESQRHELEAQLEEARTQFAKLVRDLDGRVEPVIEQFEARLDELEGRLPTAARDVVHQARQQAKDARAQVREQLTTLTGGRQAA